MTLPAAADSRRRRGVCRASGAILRVSESNSAALQALLPRRRGGRDGMRDKGSEACRAGNWKS